MNNITITSALLRKHDACRDEVARFAEQYPDGVTVSEETALQLQGARLRPRRHPSMGCAQSGARLS
jgi:hypothetical protein